MICYAAKNNQNRSGRLPGLCNINLQLDLRQSETSHTLGNILLTDFLEKKHSEIHILIKNITVMEELGKSFRKFCSKFLNCLIKDSIVFQSPPQYFPIYVFNYISPTGF